MPSYNLTIDDVSPQWKYVGLWLTDSPRDSAYTQYGKGTFHATFAPSASAALTFNGTAVTVYGAKRFNHDQYQASIDDQASSGDLNGHATSPEQFQIPLFTAGPLNPKKQHTVSLTDASIYHSRPWFDIDYAIVTLGDGDNSTRSIDITLDDGASNITYSDGWNNGSNSFVNQYYQSTFHLTQKTGATATVSFWGNAIQVFGAVSNNHGPFTVSLDGGPVIQLTGVAWKFYAQTLLYSYSGLSGGPHSLVVTHTSQNSSEWLDLDKIIVSRWEEPHSSLDDPDPNYGSISPSLIAGVVISSVALLGLLGLLLFFFFRGRRRGAGSAKKTTQIPASTEFETSVPQAFWLHNGQLKR